MIDKIVDRDNWWHFIDMPAGPQPIPAWAKGLHVDWMMGYSNPPELRAKAGENPWNWPGMRWRREGDLYITQHPDGRARFHQHCGAVSLQKFKTFRGLDADGKPVHEEREVMATTQQEGYAGRHFEITMEDGSPLILRGPWHGKRLPGYQNLTCVDMTASWVRPHARRPWHQQTACFGLYVTEDLLIRLVARFLPHLQMARVKRYGIETLEVVDPAWGCPKNEWQRLQHERAKAVAA